MQSGLEGWTFEFSASDTYRKEVQAGLEAYLGGLAPAALEGEFEAGGRLYRDGWVRLRRTLHHMQRYIGELSALRGIQDLPGLEL